MILTLLFIEIVDLVQTEYLKCGDKMINVSGGEGNPFPHYAPVIFFCYGSCLLNGCINCEISVLNVSQHVALKKIFFLSSLSKDARVTCCPGEFEG